MATMAQGSAYGPKVWIRHGRTGALVSTGEFVRETATEMVIRIRTREVVIPKAEIAQVTR